MRYIIISLFLFVNSVAVGQLPADRMVLYMPFDNIKNKHVEDRSQYGNHGIIVNATVAKGQGIYYDAIDFNGKYQYVAIKSSPSLSIADEITVSAWVYWRDVSYNRWHQWYAIISNGIEFGPWENYGMFIYGTKRNILTTYSLEYEGSNNGVMSDEYIINSEEWIHIASTFNSNRWKIYINGNKVIDYPSQKPLVAGHQDLLIGFRENSVHWFSGMIDEVTVFNIALDDNEIKILTDNIVSVEPDKKLSTTWSEIKKVR